MFACIESPPCDSARGGLRCDAGQGISAARRETCIVHRGEHLFLRRGGLHLDQAARRVSDYAGVRIDLLDRAGHAACAAAAGHAVDMEFHLWLLRCLGVGQCAPSNDGRVKRRTERRPRAHEHASMKTAATCTSVAAVEDPPAGTGRERAGQARRRLRTSSSRRNTAGGRRTGWTAGGPGCRCRCSCAARTWWRSARRRSPSSPG